MLELPPLSLYIHIPWCIKKCPYCDFNSHVAPDTIPEQEYIEALLEDYRRDAELVPDREIHSIFIGGGTPSLFSADAYDKLLRGIGSISRFAPRMECTLEANPGAVDASRFSNYLEVGINRLSIGIQSFDDEALRNLGRIHDGAQARLAIEICRDAGFKNFNLDLMHGLADQDPAMALDDLNSALAYNPRHISWYQLTIEPNTTFYSNPPLLPGEDTIMTMQAEGQQLLASQGFGRYEVSAFAKPGCESRHNLNYWMFGDYLGIGAGAHGKITLPQQDKIIRTRKIKQPRHYQQNNISYLAETTEISRGEVNVEFMMNALRLTGGFDIELFERRTGSSFSEIRKKIDYLKTLDLLQENNARIIPTGKGQLFVNSLLEEFL